MEPPEQLGVRTLHTRLRDRSEATRRTLNMNEWHTMLREAKLIDAHFTVRDATVIFVVTHTQA